MDCIVCGSQAEAIKTGGDYEQVKCPECGEHKISRSLLSTMNGMVFRVEATRDRLSQMRLRGEVPMLSSYDNDLLYAPD